SSRGQSAALASPLVVHKKESGLRVFADWTAQTAAENILLYHRAGLTRAIQEILIGIKLVIAEEFVHINLKSLGSGFDDRVYVAAAVATLTGVVEGGLNFEFTNYVDVRYRYVGAVANDAGGCARALA